MVCVDAALIFKKQFWRVNGQNTAINIILYIMWNIMVYQFNHATWSGNIFELMWTKTSAMYLSHLFSFLYHVKISTQSNRSVYNSL